jgi:ferric enterobactin receptor
MLLTSYFNRRVASVLIIIASLLVSNPTFSIGKITGKVIDAATKSTVEYAVISLLKTSDTNPTSGTLSDSTGKFTIASIKGGVYDVKVNLMGYLPTTINNISFPKDGNLDLGTIEIKPSSVELNQVSVIGTESKMSVKLDKQVFKAAQFDNAKGGNAIDILKNMPSVSVNGEGEIRLRGSSGFLVLINGKAVQSDVNSVLSQIPANSVDNVEIITSPSAKYDADGKAGIINITTRSALQDVATFIVNGQYGLPSLNSFGNKSLPIRNGDDVTLNIKNKKWDISAGASYQRNDIAGRREGDVYTLLNGIKTTFPSDGERSFIKKNYAARASVTYTFDPNNLISVGFYTAERQQSRLADIAYTNTRTNINTNAPISQFNYFNSNLQYKQGDFSLGNIDFAHTFKDKSTLTLSGLYEYALLDNNTKNRNLKDKNSTDTLSYVYNTGHSPIYGLRAKADYAIKIGTGKLESGYQLRFQKQTGSYTYQNAILGTNSFSIDPNYSADILILNRIHAVYSQYSGKSGNLEYSGGLRYEYATRTFNASKFTTPHLLTLSNLFPSVNLLYSLKPDLKIKAGLSQRIQRSTNNELNPYPEREHSETMEQGDPDILPEIVTLTELGITKDFSKGSVFATLYNQQIHNVVNRVNSVFNDTIINRVYTNAGNATLWGAELGLNIKPTAWWSCYLGGNVYDYHIVGELTGTAFANNVTVNNAGVAYSINTNQNFILDKTLSIQLTVNYLSTRPTAIGEDSRFISPNLSVRKTFFKGKLTALAQWQNIGLGIIPSNEQRITTWGSNFYTSTNYVQEKDVLWLSLGYNFNQSTKKPKLPTSEFGEREF